MFEKKNLILICDPNDQYSYQGFKILSQSKYFNVLALITSKKNNVKKIKNKYNIKIFYEDFPHKNNTIKKFIKLNNLKACVTTGYNNLIRPSFINLFKEGIYNIHPAYLPLNKGSHSTFYTIINQNNIGATLHLMNKDFDSGPIIDRKQIKINKMDDAFIVYKKSRVLGLNLLKKNLYKIYSNKYKLIHNKKSKINFKKDIKKYNYISVSQRYSGTYI